MAAAPVVTVLERVGRRSSASRRTRPSRPTAWSFEGVGAVEIVVPDRHCAVLLLEYAAPLFTAELVSEPGWIVRLHPPPTRGEWVIELLALVERWLESAPLPCAKVIHDGRSYLFRSSTGAAIATVASASAPASAPARRWNRDP